MRVLSFGEVLWDVYPDSKCIGGAPFNFAAHIARLGGEAYLCSAVGRDALGEETIAEVQKEGVLTDFITRSSKKTGQCLVTLNAQNVPSYNLLSDVAYDDISISPFPSDIDAFYFGTLSLREAHNRAVLKEILDENRFSEIFVDLNIRKPFSTAQAVAFALEHATVLKISDEELPTVLDFLHMEKMPCAAAARELARRYPCLSLILMTLGAEGAYLYDAKNEKEYRTPAVKTETVSTVGAGDSFAAAFLSRYFLTKDISCSLSFAAKIAAFVVSRKEAVPPYTFQDFV